MANTIYTSGKAPKSKILTNSLNSRLSAMFGFGVSKDKNSKNAIERAYGIKFVKVDLSNPQYKVHNAEVGSVFTSANLSEKLETYFEAYLNENSLTYDNIADRKSRLNSLTYFAANCAFGARVVQLVADEATQMDVQDRLISIECPDRNFINKTYELFSKWGITQTRVHGVCADLELYGESFWAQNVTENGVEKITPISVYDIIERLEFDPVKISEYLGQKSFNASMERSQKLKDLIDMIKNGDAMETSDCIADFFDKKLFGYELHNNTIVPPWTITHFRYEPEHNEFKPYGKSPLLNCLGPFKKSYSAQALQALARSMSFPVTLYKVKNTAAMSPSRAHEVVNEVREEYDNIGTTPVSQGDEVYTVNTKIWLANDLLEVDVKDSKCDIDFVGDIELYEDKVAIAAGVPKAYLDQEYGGFGNSGISLMEQYKPFGRLVYSIQSSFLQGLGELIRLHYAITGEFDYNTPFVLSMRFPAEEASADREERKTAAIELTNSIMDLLRDALAMEDDEQLPQDVVKDILGKYSFLDPTDIDRWVKATSVENLKKVTTSDEDDDSGDDGDFGFGGGDGSDALGMGATDDGSDTTEDAAVEESYIKEINRRKKLLNEYKRAQRVLKEKRMKEITERYRETASNIYVRFLEANNMTEFNNSLTGRHDILIPKIDKSSKLFESVKVLSGKKSDRRLKEKSNGPKIDDFVGNKDNFVAKELSNAGLIKKED